MLDEQSGFSKGDNRDKKIAVQKGIWSKDNANNISTPLYSDSGGASRFFYCAKASANERGVENNHPTVKPLKLMKYLIKLIAPPKDGLILDPFCGSGSTLLAAKEIGVDAIGIEKEQEYVKIAQARLSQPVQLEIG